MSYDLLVSIINSHIHAIKAVSADNFYVSSAVKQCFDSFGMTAHASEMKRSCLSSISWIDGRVGFNKDLDHLGMSCCSCTINRCPQRTVPVNKGFSTMNCSDFMFPRKASKKIKFTVPLLRFSLDRIRGSLNSEQSRILWVEMPKGFVHRDNLCLMPINAQISTQFYYH